MLTRPGALGADVGSSNDAWAVKREWLFPVRIVSLEDENLVVRHQGEIDPALLRIVDQLIGLADAIRALAFHFHEIAALDGPGIADRQRLRFYRAADRAPNLNDREAIPQQLVRLVGQ